METLTKPPSQFTDSPAWKETPFRTAAVLGAGVMGSQIAAHLANAGVSVTLFDVTPKAIGKEGAPNSIVEGAFKAAAKLKPDPFFTAEAQKRVTLGNFDDDFDAIKDADWIIEVVVERLDVKQAVMKRIEDAARADAVVSSNTSGLPISDIVDGRSDAFKKRFLGTHFFNPPRYLKLFEVIPTPDTRPDVLRRVSAFARVHLGKGVVVAKDTPNFIGNRIGVYGMMSVFDEFSSGRYSIEEIDALTGTLIGHAKSATFRTADVVGLDTLRHVASEPLRQRPGRRVRETFKVPAVLDALVEDGKTGQKAGAGFFKKEGKTILSVDPETLEYTPAKESDINPKAFKGSLEERLVALWDDDGRAGDFFRRTTLDLLGYAARRVPEIADSPADIDRAIRWGFGWQMGPFQMWDTLGIDRVREALKRGRHRDARLGAATSPAGFYKDDGEPTNLDAWRGRLRADPKPADEWGLTYLKADDTKTLWSNSEAALLDAGDGVACSSSARRPTASGRRSRSGLVEAIEHVENDRDLRGMIVGNEGSNFSVGANLGEVVMGMSMGGASSIEPFIKGFQDAILKVRYATKPVVVATHQMVLGGGCEMTMASPHPVASAETYIGLVELGVGLIPAGCGTTFMTAKAAEAAANTEFPSDIQPFLRQHFEQIAMAKVATSARAGAGDELPRRQRDGRDERGPPLLGRQEPR